MVLIPTLTIFEEAIEIFFGFFSGGIGPGVIMILSTFIIVMLMGRISPHFVVFIIAPLAFTLIATGFGLPTYVFPLILIFMGMNLSIGFFVRLLNK